MCVFFSNNRDEYIEINWKNIKEDAKLNFKKFAARVSMFNTEYDFDSITHYSSSAFAKDKKVPTIIAKKAAPNMGQRKGEKMNLISVTIKLNAQTFHLCAAFLLSSHSNTEMSAGDITRLSRMYHCPNFEASITLNEPTTKFPNGVNTKQVELNKTKDNTSTADDPVMAVEKIETKLNPNDTLTNDNGDDDDMILEKYQIDALYSLNAAKRNGLKNAFHHWPLGIVAFEIDPTFSKDFTAFHIFRFSFLPRRFCFYSRKEMRT